MELLLKLLEKLGELLKLRKEQSRAFFEDHIEPIYSMVREVTDDYIRMFDETREQVADDSISLTTIHKTLVSRRKKLELVRIELVKYAKSMCDFHDNDQIENFALNCFLLIEHNPVIECDIFHFRTRDISLNGLIEISGATSLIKFIKDTMRSETSYSREDILDYIDDDIERTKEKWGEITNVYIHLRKEMLK